MAIFVAVCVSLFFYFLDRGSLSVMINTDCPLDRITHETGLLGFPMRDYPDEFNCNGKIHPKGDQHYSLSQGSGLHKKE